MAGYRFDESANLIYHFTWASFCDWYLELIKPVLSPEGDPAEAEETRIVAGWVLDQILVMLHPFMPFITEELWHALAPPARPRPYDLILAKWPMPDARALDAEAGPEIDWLIRLVSEIRAARAELGIPPGILMPCFIADADPLTVARLQRHDAVIRRMARLKSVELATLENAPRMSVVLDEATFHFPLIDIIDVETEQSRLAKALAAAEKERDSLAGRLANSSFIERAKPEAVEKARLDHSEKAAESDRIAAALARLS